MIAFFRWYTTRGEYAQDHLKLQSALLIQAIAVFGREPWHIFDRGYAGKRWLGELPSQQVGVVLRWPKRYQLVTEQGGRAAWQIAQGRATLVHRQVWNVHQQQWRKRAALALAYTHADYADQALWLVVSRLGKGREPWYLLTNQPCDQVDVLWSVVLAYARRYQIEVCISKSELALQSPHLWFWANRLKLMMIVGLVYAFLLSLLVIDQLPHRLNLLRTWCHRTGKRCQSALTPLYRLRAALAALLDAYQIIRQTSG